MRDWKNVLWALLLAVILIACQNQDPTPTSTSESVEADEGEVTEIPTATETTIPATTTSEPEPTATTAPTATLEVTYEPLFETATCEFQSPPGREVTCGWLTVPEDRANPEKTIRLHVAVLPAKATTQPRNLSFTWKVDQGEMLWKQCRLFLRCVMRHF